MYIIRYKFRCYQFVSSLNIYVKKSTFHIDFTLHLISSFSYQEKAVGSIISSYLIGCRSPKKMNIQQNTKINTPTSRSWTFGQKSVSWVGNKTIVSKSLQTRDLTQPRISGISSEFSVASHPVTVELQIAKTSRQTEAVHRLLKIIFLIFKFRIYNLKLKVIRKCIKPFHDELINLWFTFSSDFCWEKVVFAYLKISCCEFFFVEWNAYITLLLKNAKALIWG